MLTDLFGDEPSRQKARPEKKAPEKKVSSKPKKNSAAPEPKANRFAGRSSNKPKISVSPQAVDEPVDKPEPEQKMPPSKNTRISASPALDNSAGNLIRAVDTFRMFGMVDE
ncbi:hypothetical protein SEA_CAMERICO_77 [Gordonia phage Camerico]|nr:hypothetical protein SEA_CAMERICO_77 [Gordonia phage Camerico]